MELGDDFAETSYLESFPTTHWTTLGKTRGPMTSEQREVLNCLIARYWRPVYAYIRHSGHRSNALDLTQDFFAYSLAPELFARADPARGRFRTFLLKCLNNFLKDVGRRERRQAPAEGIISIQQWATEDRPPFEPSRSETAEGVFLRSWVYELLMRVWAILEQEYEAAGKQLHCQLFHKRVFEPALRGTSQPPLRELAEEAGLTEKQASNRIVTTMRAFRRLLRKEIELYAGSEDEVSAEIRDLFRFASKS